MQSFDFEEDYYPYPAASSAQPAPASFSFFGIARGVARMGLLFAGAQLVTLLAIASGAIANYLFLVGTCLLVTLIGVCFSRDVTRQLLLIFLTVAVFGLLSALWDRAYTWFQSQQDWVLQGMLVAGVLLIVLGLDQRPRRAS